MRRLPLNDPSPAAATTLRSRRAGELAKGPPMSTSTPAADKPYPLASLIAFSTVGIPLAGMLLAFGLWTPRYYVTLLHNGGKEAVAATALVGLAFWSCARSTSASTRSSRSAWTARARRSAATGPG